MAQRESFEPDHPIRRFLKPFSFRSFSINKGAAQHLVDKHGILHHAVALSWEGAVLLLLRLVENSFFFPVCCVTPVNVLTPTDPSLLCSSGFPVRRARARPRAQA